jgi:small subunit ribosomal protein S2
MEIDGTFEHLTKKEVSSLLKEKAKLEKNLGGIKEMKDLPGIVFVIDPKKEAIAVAEAKRLNIPVIAVVDTNCNPDGIDYPIPGNDDAIRAITLFTQIIANAVVEADNEIGLTVIDSLQEDDAPGFDSSKVSTKPAEKTAEKPAEKAKEKVVESKPEAEEEKVEKVKEEPSAAKGAIEETPETTEAPETETEA